MNQARRWEKLVGSTKSPIECDLLRAFCDAAVTHGYGVQRRPSDGVIGVRPQEPIGPFFLDIGVWFRFFGHEFRIAVEADGHAFHERTARQAQRDRTRERLIAALGWRVLRFTGREVNADAGACGAEILDHIMDFQTAAICKAAGRMA